MDILNQKIKAVFERWRDAGLLHVAYALLAEALLIGFIIFSGFFTLETLLPTFISVRISLAGFFMVLMLGTFALSLLGRYLDIDSVSGLRRRNPLIWIGILWAAGILTISLIKFPLFLIPVIILALLGIGYLFLSLFFDGKD